MDIPEGGTYASVYPVTNSFCFTCQNPLQGIVISPITFGARFQPNKHVFFSLFSNLFFELVFLTKFKSCFFFFVSTVQLVPYICLFPSHKTGVTVMCPALSCECCRYKLRLPHLHSKYFTPIYVTHLPLKCYVK